MPRFEPRTGRWRQRAIVSGRGADHGFTMPEAIGYSQVCAMLSAAAAQIHAHHEMLSRLDSAIGDGDHGTTLLRAMEALAKAVSEDRSGDLQTLFASIAWAVMSCDGGSTGPLLGSFFMGMSAAAGGKTTLGPADVTALFEGGVAQLQKQSRAGVGDKTMMDAFLPALAALQQADPAAGIPAALERAAEAAARGAEATKAMRARFGRARHLGERALGHADPGAVSASLLFKGFSEGVRQP
jgi:phosphoenolpyruvate---glycerone phosphotransferase subunit DhaL